VNGQSVTVMPMTVNSIQQGIVASLLGMCEAHVPGNGEVTACPGHAKRGGDAMSGGWRRNGGKVHNRKRGELSVQGRRFMAPRGSEEPAGSSQSLHSSDETG